MLRETIERGVRHRWLGPLFVVLLCLMLAMLFMHDMHEGHIAATELGEFCLGLTIMFGLMVLIRVRVRLIERVVLRLPARAPPPARRVSLLVPSAINRIAPPLRL